MNLDQLKLAWNARKAAKALQKEVAMPDHSWKKTLSATAMDFAVTSGAVFFAYFATPESIVAFLNSTLASLSTETRADLVPFLSALIVMGRKYWKFKVAPKLVDSGAPPPLVLLPMLLLPSMVFAQAEPTPAPLPSPSPTPLVTTVISVGSTRYYTPNVSDKTELEGQITVEVRAPKGLVIDAFGRLQRQQGTVPISATSFYSVLTFRSVNAHLGIRKDLKATDTLSLAVGCTAGLSWDVDRKFDPTDPNIWQAGCGPRAALARKGSLWVRVGHDGAVAGAGLFGELVVNQSPSVRYVATFTVPFSAEQFRKNPGTFTTGLQVDVPWKIF